MKKILFIVLVVLVILLVLFFIILNYAGFFNTINIIEKEMGPYVLVYKDHIGEYKDTGKIQNDIYNSLLNDHKIETFKGFGIYYDDPKQVPAEELRSIAGCILEEKDYDKIPFLKESGFNLQEKKEDIYIYADFPFKNTLSIIAGIIKVYPEFDKYLKSNNLSGNEVMEIYDIPGKKIFYLMKRQ